MAAVRQFENIQFLSRGIISPARMYREAGQTRYTFADIDEGTHYFLGKDLADGALEAVNDVIRPILFEEMNPTNDHVVARSLESADILPRVVNRGDYWEFVLTDHQNELFLLSQENVLMRHPVIEEMTRNIKQEYMRRFMDHAVLAVAQLSSRYEEKAVVVDVVEPVYEVKTPNRDQRVSYPVFTGKPAHIDSPKTNEPNRFFSGSELREPLLNGATPVSQDMKDEPTGKAKKQSGCCAIFYRR